MPPKIFPDTDVKIAVYSQTQRRRLTGEKCTESDEFTAVQVASCRDLQSTGLASMTRILLCHFCLARVYWLAHAQ